MSKEDILKKVRIREMVCEPGYRFLKFDEPVEEGDECSPPAYPDIWIKAKNWIECEPQAKNCVYRRAVEQETPSPLMFSMTAEEWLKIVHLLQKALNPMVPYDIWKSQEWNQKNIQSLIASAKHTTVYTALTDLLEIANFDDVEEAERYIKDRSE